ncbi:unnamed protein product [Allacma fusca]|uniref:Uncharacterized protein n=1 Tax=Allacma fusca TaxID=39272 RepID=A0A8J2PD47_9HEXA|nr:unnamed protein product [Allacma fusca]
MMNEILETAIKSVKLLLELRYEVDKMSTITSEEDQAVIQKLKDISATPEELAVLVKEKQIVADFEHRLRKPGEIDRRGLSGNPDIAKHGSNLSFN